MRKLLTAGVAVIFAVGICFVACNDKSNPTGPTYTGGHSEIIGHWVGHTTTVLDTATHSNGTLTFDLNVTANQKYAMIMTMSMTITGVNTMVAGQKESGTWSVVGDTLIATPTGGTCQVYQYNVTAGTGAWADTTCSTTASKIDIKNAVSGNTWTMTDPAMTLTKQ